MLGVTIENYGDVAVLRCSGRIVVGEEAWTLYNSVISLKNKRVLVLDLTRVSRVDARGLGVLVFLEQWACGAGVKVQLIPSKPVHELLDLTGLDSLFDIRASENVPPASDFLVDSRVDNTAGAAADD